MNKVDYFLPLLPYPSLYYIPHYNFLYYSTHLYCPFILFHNIHSLLQSFPFLYLIPSYSSSPYYISFYYTPFIIFPLTPSTQLLSPFPISPLLYSPPFYYIHPLLHSFYNPSKFYFTLPNPKFLYYFFSYHITKNHLNPTNSSIYYFITFNLTTQNSSSSPFLHPLNIPSFYYFAPYPTSIYH